MTKRMMMVFAALFSLDAILARVALAGGPKAADLVVVADTRVLTSETMIYFANLYNTDILLFAIWTVVLTVVMGMTLGFGMDKLMSHTGLDLTSRKIIEH